MKQTIDLVLASGSPRRKQLLEQAGFVFTVLSIDVNEDYPEATPIRDVAAYLAQKKSSAALQEIKPDQVVITADTVVIIGKRILGKPVDTSDAKQMLWKLSGSTHLVTTGVCIASSGRSEVISNTTSVTFRDMKDWEIDHYIKECKPFDKAGAYGIQDWIGLTCVTKIEGSYFNVVGLPIHEVYSVLSRWM